MLLLIARLISQPTQAAKTKLHSYGGWETQGQIQDQRKKLVSGKELLSGSLMVPFFAVFSNDARN